VNIGNNLETGSVNQHINSDIDVPSSNTSINLSRSDTDISNQSPKLTHQPPVEAIGDQPEEELNNRDNSQISIESVLDCDNSANQSVEV